MRKKIYIAAVIRIIIVARLNTIEILLIDKLVVVFI